MGKEKRIGITCGDINGVGPELIVNLIDQEVITQYCTPVAYVDEKVVRTYAELLEQSISNYHLAESSSDIVDGKFNIRPLELDLSATPGEKSTAGATAALKSLNMALDEIQEGHITNLLTSPLDKSLIAEIEEGFDGHTGYLERRFESNTTMILLDDELKVAMVTGHQALSQVGEAITEERITAVIRRLIESLRFDFNISHPKIAVLGLNPHLGDGGILGTQEIDTIKPAIDTLRSEGILVEGPFSPDGFFGAGNEKLFDLVLGMYHDQVLIPFKQKSFRTGVNYTAGLPFVRTSPDHGPAFDLAGNGIVDHSSFINALFAINKIHRNRVDNFSQKAEFLQFREHRREKFSIGVPDLK